MEHKYLLGTSIGRGPLLAKRQGGGLRWRTGCDARWRTDATGQGATIRSGFELDLQSSGSGICRLNCPVEENGDLVFAPRIALRYAAETQPCRFAP